jgi:hypothetical protein
MGNIINPARLDRVLIVMQLQTLFRKVPVFRTLIFYLIFIVKIEVIGAYSLLNRGIDDTKVLFLFNIASKI